MQAEEAGKSRQPSLSAQWDPNHDAATDAPTTSYIYDALDRLVSVSQPWAGGGDAVTTYGFDVQDHLVEVTDAEGNTTSYTYSDLDLLTQEISPVSGTTAHTYDDHGEFDTTTDARGITVSRTIDPLDRVPSVAFLPHHSPASAARRSEVSGNPLLSRGPPPEGAA